jgi:hypothetical protein
LKINPIIPAFFLTLLFFACSNRPWHILSEKKMEKVLYDIYLAEAGITTHYNVFSSDSARKHDLLKSVLEKHKITEAALDTSLAWYAGRLDRYFKITENVSKRFAETSEVLRLQQEATMKLNLADGVLFLPVEKERFFLRPVDLPHKTYIFETDTTFYNYGGTYELQFSIMGLPASLHPVVILRVQCADTTFVKRDTISRNGLFVSSVDILPDKQAEKFYGSIYFPEVPPALAVFIQDFTLSRRDQSFSESGWQN